MFGIQINDGTDITSKIVQENNEKVIDLYDWQERAIEFFEYHNNKAIFKVATGSGKTFLAIEIYKRILEKNPLAKCLVVVPKNVIIETGWYKEFYQSGFSIVDIGVFYGLTKEYSKITITNMQSIDKVAIDIFDVVIFDEIHNYTTKRLIKYVNHKFKYKIGLSATIERVDNRHWDLLKAFNYNVFSYSPHEAIRDGVLNPFDFYNIDVVMDDETYEEYLELTKKLNTILQVGGGFNKIMRSAEGTKYKMLSLMNKRKQLINNYDRKFDVVKKICLKHKGEKILIFNQYNSQTTKLYWHLLDVGIKARIIHSDVKKEQREKNLIDFKNDQFSVLLTSKVLDEGYNLPSISCAIIMAGDSTPRQTIQRMGRVLRKKKNKSVLYQIYCKGTMEEEQGLERGKLFKELSNFNKDYTYDLGKELILDD